MRRIWGVPGRRERRPCLRVQGQHRVRCPFRVYQLLPRHPTDIAPPLDLAPYRDSTRGARALPPNIQVHPLSSHACAPGAWRVELDRRMGAWMREAAHLSPRAVCPRSLFVWPRTSFQLPVSNQIHLPRRVIAPICHRAHCQRALCHVLVPFLQHADRCACIGSGRCTRGHEWQGEQAEGTHAAPPFEIHHPPSPSASRAWQSRCWVRDLAPEEARRHDKAEGSSPHFPRPQQPPFDVWSGADGGEMASPPFPRPGQSHSHTISRCNHKCPIAPPCRRPGPT